MDGENDRILLVEGDIPAPAALVAALRSSRMPVDVARPEQALALASMIRYAVIAGVPRDLVPSGLSEVLGELAPDASLIFADDGVDALFPASTELLDRVTAVVSAPYEEERVHRAVDLAFAQHQARTPSADDFLVSDRAIELETTSSRPAVRIARALSRAMRSGLTLAVVRIELDWFDHMQTALGDAAATMVIACAENRLRESVREVDSVIATEGPTFFLVLEGIADETSLLPALDRIKTALEAPLDIGGGSAQLGASAGVAVWPGDGSTAHRLLDAAHRALTRAQAGGRNQIRFAKTSLDDKATTRRSTLAEIKTALEARRFHLLYQPLFGLLGGKLLGVEALLRWRRDDGTWAEPRDFISVLDQTGGIDGVGEWVLQNACRQAQAWRRDTGRKLRVGVNLSARQLAGPIVTTVEKALRDSELPPSQLELEVPEQVLVHDAHPSHDVLRELKELGVRLSIDDFGTGSASLRTIGRMPIDAVKIDRSIIAAIGRDHEAGSLARMAIGAARSLGIDSVAEGVETRTQHAFLSDNGCTAAQGYLTGRPVTADALSACLRV